MRKAQAEKQIQLGNRVSILIAVITNGSNCSNFETGIIAKKLLKPFVIEKLPLL